MKKYIAKNPKTNDKIFCKYETTKNCILVVKYFLPKEGFSVIWDKDNASCRIGGLVTTRDNRKTVVTYNIHPSYWNNNLNDYKTIFDAMDICFSNNISLHI